MLTRLLVGICLLTLAAPRLALAQFGTMCSNCSSYAVAVTPDGQAAPDRLPNTSGHQAVFTVRNAGSGNAPDNYILICAYVAPVNSCSVSQSMSGTLVTGQSIPITVTYSVGGAGTGGRIRLRAWSDATAPVVSDWGHYNVNVTNTVVAVAVTPDNGSVGTVSGNPYQATFRVTNTGTHSTTYALSHRVAGNIANPSLSHSSVTLATGAFQDVTLSYNTGLPGTGEVWVRATAGSVKDSGNYNVTIAPAPGAPIVALRNHNADNRDRSLCLTSGAGEGGAFQCGDLLVSHGLPATTTMGKARSLTLLYNSDQAAPKPVVAAAVTRPTTVAQPDLVKAVLEIDIGGGYVARDSGSWAAWSGTRQIVLSYNASADTTGVYPFRLKVRHQYPSATHESVVNGNVIVVDRRASEFGRGWSVAGLERLGGYVASTEAWPNRPILWVGGDGSARLYSPVASYVWVAAPGAYRDTLRYDVATSRYTRTLRHGVRVEYDANGRQVATIGRTGHATTFWWSAAGKLDSITVPPAGQPYRTYRVQYDGAGKLDRIIDPVGRVLDATVTGGNLVTLRGPDTVTTSFTYRPDGRMESRAARGYTTSYEYALDLRLSRVIVPRLGTVRDTTGFEPWDEKGRYLLGENRPAVDTAQVNTRVLGPRPNVADDASFWVDRWGAPTKIIDAVGARTDVERLDTRFPAFVTRVVRPNGRRETATYNDRGNLTEQRITTAHLDARPDRVISYSYDDPNEPDAPSAIRDGLNRTTTYVYHPTYRLPTLVTDPKGHQTEYTYYDGTKAGLVKDITERSVETWHHGLADDAVAAQDQIHRFDYDVRGNLRKTISPTGVVTAIHADSAGRVRESIDPLGTRTRWVYDVLNRATAHIRHTGKFAPPDGDPLASCVATQVICQDLTAPFNPVLGDSVTAHYRYGPLALDSVIDPRGNSRRFSYDAIGRVVKEYDEYRVDDYTIPREATYDGAGNLVQSLGRTFSAYTGRSTHRDTVRMEYDALDRRTKLAWSATPYAAPLATIEWIPADSVRYWFDAIGLIDSAVTSTGRIVRTYYRDGLLRTVKTVLVGFADSVEYDYDRTGAVTRASRTFDGKRDVLTYQYHAGTGELQSMTMEWGVPAALSRTLSFAWDALGRRRQITYPNGMVVKYGYDAAGVLRRLVSTNPEGGQHDNFEFTYRADSVDAVGRILEHRWICHAVNGTTDPGSACGGSSGSKIQSSGYNRFGMLVRQSGGPLLEEFRYDAAGNMIYRKAGTEVHHLRIAVLSNWLLADSIPGQTSNSILQFDYVANGSRLRDFTANQATGGNDQRRFYYDGLGRTVGIRDFDHDGPNRSHCMKYDPEGQLAIACEGESPWLVHQGANVVATMGRRWVFVHGPGVDDPLMGLWRDPNSSTGWQDFYWVTDGQGRQFAVGTPSGNLSAWTNAYFFQGGKYAGGVSNGHTFSAERFETSWAPGLSFFRNRLYDQATGRWTQEDPIGIAGGANLYQFNGNNPVTYADPFGLCPTCLPALAAGVAVGGIRLAANLLTGRPAFENVGRDGIFAGTAVLTLGAVPAIAAATTNTAGAADVAAATNLTIQFGKVANQVSHTFRHTDAAGLDRAQVKAAVEKHLTGVASQVTPGKTLNQTIEVAGQRIQYSAHQIAEGVVNVGRIHRVD